METLQTYEQSLHVTFRRGSSAVMEINGLSVYFLQADIETKAQPVNPLQS